MADTDWIATLQNVVSEIINKYFVAILIVLIGFVIGKIAGRFLLKALKEIQLNKIVKDISGIRSSLEGIISHFVEYFIYFVSIVMALRHIGIYTDILNILSAVVIILIGIFIILSVKDFIPNIISGIVMHQKSDIKEGDIIEYNKIRGKIIDFSLLETKLETKTGDIIIIPNSNLTKNEIIKRKKF
ncbi:mechanosensitive ion channel [Candidatus Woesearchaeota archaeon]|nr:mechanosensitive ion channel [Candidatus Woesearchaeota archaeon]